MRFCPKCIYRPALPNRGYCGECLKKLHLSDTELGKSIELQSYQHWGINGEVLPTHMFLAEQKKRIRTIEDKYTEVDSDSTLF